MSQRIAWIVTTDGRQEFIEDALPTWQQATGNVTYRAILDDSGDPDYREWLRVSFPDWTIIAVGVDRMGYNAAMKRVRHTGLNSGADYIFHLEDDFRLNRPLNLDRMSTILFNNPHLAQMALVRQPWYHNEVEAGGLIQALQMQGARFHEKHYGGDHWLEHRAVWTANPNMFPLSVARIPYPDGAWSESAFMQIIRKEPRLSCAYWGRLGDDPLVHHIGHYKAGTDY